MSNSKQYDIINWLQFHSKTDTLNELINFLLVVREDVGGDAQVILDFDSGECDLFIYGIGNDD